MAEILNLNVTRVAVTVAILTAMIPAARVSRTALYGLARRFLASSDSAGTV